MAVIFLLGPGMWSAEKGASSKLTPMDVRRDIAKGLATGGHRVILMEDDPTRKGEGMIQKFDRLLRGKVTHVVVYWPPQAKMQTTYDELILLCDREEFLTREKIPIWLLHHSDVAKITKNEFEVREQGNRSRYLMDVARLGVSPFEWQSEADLKEAVRLLSAELAG